MAQTSSVPAGRHEMSREERIRCSLGCTACSATVEVEGVAHRGRQVDRAGRAGAMQRVRCGPCHGGQPGWRGRHGCAYEDGSRASWHDGGYSAEKSACSRWLLQDDRQMRLSPLQQGEVTGGRSIGHLLWQPHKRHGGMHKADTKDYITVGVRTVFRQTSTLPLISTGVDKHLWTTSGWPRSLAPAALVHLGHFPAIFYQNHHLLLAGALYPRLCITLWMKVLDPVKREVEEFALLLFEGFSVDTDQINDVGSSWRKVVRTLERDDRVSPRQRGFVVLAQAKGLIGTTLLVAVPNELTREVFQSQQLKEPLQDALRDVFQDEILCAFSVDTDMVTQTEPEPEPEVAPSPASTAGDEVRAQPTPPSTSHEFGRLNPKYIFDTFVIGSSNRFAHAAAVAVAEAAPVRLA